MIGRGVCAAGASNDLQTWQAKFNGQTPDYQHISQGQVRSYHDQFTTAANAFSQQQQSQAAEFPFLQFLHGRGTLGAELQCQQHPSDVHTANHRLSKAGTGWLPKVKLDGTVMDGNTRLYVLKERGVDISNLPWDIHTSEPIAPWESPEEEGPIDPIP